MVATMSISKANAYCDSVGTGFGLFAATGLLTEAEQEPLHTPTPGGVTVAVLATVPLAVIASLAVMV